MAFKAYIILISGSYVLLNVFKKELALEMLDRLKRPCSLIKTRINGTNCCVLNTLPRLIIIPLNATLMAIDLMDPQILCNGQESMGGIPNQYLSVRKLLAQCGSRMGMIPKNIFQECLIVMKMLNK